MIDSCNLSCCDNRPPTNGAIFNTVNKLPNSTVVTIICCCDRRECNVCFTVSKWYPVRIHSSIFVRNVTGIALCRNKQKQFQDVDITNQFMTKFVFCLFSILDTLFMSTPNDFRETSRHLWIDWCRDDGGIHHPKQKTKMPRYIHYRFKIQKQYWTA